VPNKALDVTNLKAVLALPSTRCLAAASPHRAFASLSPHFRLGASGRGDRRSKNGGGLEQVSQRGEHGQ
jgi:hypothetical protein